MIFCTIGTIYCQQSEKRGNFGMIVLFLEFLSVESICHSREGGNLDSTNYFLDPLRQLADSRG